MPYEVPCFPFYWAMQARKAIVAKYQKIIDKKRGAENTPKSRDPGIPLKNTKPAENTPKSRDPGIPLENTKPPPPRKSPKITQKLQFGPPRACPENYRKITKKCNFLLVNY